MRTKELVETKAAKKAKPVKLDLSFIGKSIFIRSVTNYYTGRLVKEDDNYYYLEDAAWVADTGRFAEALATDKLSEIEPYPDGVVKVSVGACVDHCLWNFPLPRVAK